METIGRVLLECSLDTVGGNELPLSVHKVVSDDDLLNEILVKLPVTSLVLFKSVSKRWLSLIKSPTFSKHQSRIPKIGPPCGLFIKRDSKHGLYGFVPLDSRIPSWSENTFKIESGSNSSNLTILQSCNGLFLCSVNTGQFCVYNPTLKLLNVLIEPDSSEPEKSCFISMAFDPNKSPHYKVVHAAAIAHDYPAESYRIQTYSSESGQWSIVCSHSDPFEGLRSGVYCNDAIHWISRDYNGGALHNKLDLNTVVLKKIRLPVTGDNFCKLFESRGRLLLLDNTPLDNTHSRDQLNVYEMGNGGSEWLLKYVVNQWRITLGGVSCITLGEKEEDSFMVLELNGKVVLYNFVLQTFRQLPEVELMLPETRLSSIDSFLFTASFASV